MRKDEITLDAVKLSLKKPGAVFGIQGTLSFKENAASTQSSRRVASPEELKEAETEGHSAQFVDVGALVYKATGIVENTVQMEEKEWAERRISLKDAEHMIGSRVYKSMDDKTLQFRSVTPSRPGNDVRQYPRPNEDVQLTSTALVGEPKGKQESYFWPRKRQTACDCRMDNSSKRSLLGGEKWNLCVIRITTIGWHLSLDLGPDLQWWDAVGLNGLMKADSAHISPNPQSVTTLITWWEHSIHEIQQSSQIMLLLH